MQVKKVGNRYQLIRYAGFVKETRSIKSKLIGSIPVGSTIIPEDIYEILTSEERTKLWYVLDKAQSELQPLLDQAMLTSLVSNLQGATRGLRAGNGIEEAAAKLIRDAVVDLHAALRDKVGPGKKVVKTKRVKAAKEGVAAEEVVVA